MPYAFQIRRIHDAFLPGNQEIIQRVQELFRANFPGADPTEADGIPDKLTNPFINRFRTVLLVVDNPRGEVLGFALMLHDPEIGFCYLDWLATATGRRAGGLGGALYERVREEAAALKVHGLFYECLPDDPDGCPDEMLRKQNATRLKFYERYGARPIIGTAYESPINPGDTMMPHLVFDGLDHLTAPGRDLVQKIFRAILERKYGNLCDAAYIRRVVHSVTADPVELRPLRYVRPQTVRPAVAPRGVEPIALVVSEHHAVHHVRDRGYVEAPVRIDSIRNELTPDLCQQIVARRFSDQHVLSVHDRGLVEYLRTAGKLIDERKPLYPYVFPLRNRDRRPKEPSVLPGYWCIDTFTPIYRYAWPAARSAVDCALTAADELLSGRRLAYALVRPPGHHAESQVFGGFCYLNNNAIAANYLSVHGRVAILDLDYHHGNGQQEIFYRRADVYTVSIHGHPRFAYPYFAGFSHETGEGEGQGYNLNLPLGEDIDGSAYLKTLERALRAVADFAPDFLVLALGLDTAKGDPTGTWRLLARDFEANGRRVGELGLPTLVVQEGGYHTRTLGANAQAFLTGLLTGSELAADRLRLKRGPPRSSYRYEVRPEDTAIVRRLTAATGFFRDDEVEVAVELVQERLAKGLASGYHFVFAERDDRVLGYACYGPIACTIASHDLYWIVVDPAAQGRGLGKTLMVEIERLVAASGGTRIYIETSTTDRYAGTRGFYERCGYVAETVLDDFYGPGDGKVIFSRKLLPPRPHKTTKRQAAV